MNYLCYLFLNNLVHVEEESRFIDGKEQPCLIIPTATNQIKKGRQGNWLMIFRLSECPPNANHITHDIQLTYLDEESLQKSYEGRYHSRTAHLGRVYEHSGTTSKKIDRTNYFTDIECDGVLSLSDIPDMGILMNTDNHKRYVQNVVFKAIGDDNRIFTGVICLDEIPARYVWMDPNTGKKYVNTRFKKLSKLDTYMNTHHLVIMVAGGSEIEIGRFKEWVRTESVQNPSTPAPRNEAHPTTVNPAPYSIDGIKF